MPDDDEKTARARRDDIYRLIRIDTERAVDRLLTVLRNRSDDAVDQYMRAGETNSDTGDEAGLTETDVDRIAEIRLSHSMAFAHALLQGAADAFEDHKTGLTLLKRLIDVELTEIEQDARFVGQATTTGSNAIN
jgi:hypothetical protein